MDVHQAVVTLVAFEFTLCSVQFCVDFLKSLIDESFRTAGYLVLVFVGLTFVAYSQLAQIVYAALYVLVIQLYIES